MPRWHVASLDDYRRAHARSLADPEGYWGEAAKTLRWSRPWTRVLEWNPPDAKWFVGGRTNVCDNCVDRQVDEGFGDRTAIVWEGEPLGAGGPEIRRINYLELKRSVCRLGNALRSLGVRRGDVVTIYMGMVPEVAVAMLACARIGAAHSVIFGGFSAQAIVDRVLDADSKVIITCDGAWRRGTVVPLKENVDSACAALEQAGRPVRAVVVHERTGNPVAWHSLRDHRMADLCLGASEECPCEPMDSEDMLFLLYTSGSTGKPKGILHTTGGYMVFAAHTARLTFNLVPDVSQLYWCTADVGWVVTQIHKNDALCYNYNCSPRHR